MKKLVLIPFAILLSMASLAQSVSATYTVADIPTGDGSYDPACNGPLTTLLLNVPIGANVTGVDVAYDMTAGGGGWMSEQRSQLYCQETGLDEGGDASGAANNAGTFAYNRTGLALANGISATGVLTFEMRAFRTWTGTAGCNTSISKVDNNTWSITVYYVNPIPMVYVSSTSTQNNTTLVPICSANEEIIGLEVVMDGGLNLKDITELQIDMTGTSNIADVANIDIFYTGTNPAFSPSNLFANAAPAAGTIVFNGTQTLAPGTNYFWIAYDVSAAPVIANILDAQCTQITIDGIVYSPAITDPLGNRSLGVCAGTPGGISSNLTLWLDGTDGANFGGVGAANGGSVDTWMNRQTNAACPDLNQATANKMPLFKENVLNFNPVVSFDGSNDQLDRNVLGSAIFSTTNNTIFFVHKYYNGTVYFKWEQGASGNRVGYENSGGFTRFDFPTDGAGNQNIGTFAYDTLGQIVTATTDASNSVLRNMGLQNSSNPISGTLNNSFTSNLSIGENVSFSVPSLVDFAEIVIYNETLSVIEQNKVESYLAIKYGMTLGINGTSLNYNSSSGTIIWDATANAGFNYDIAGISRDDLTDQDQRKSKSINEIAGVDRSILTVANGTNFSSPVLPSSDLTHFVWGNNDGATNFSAVTPFSTVNAVNIGAVLDRHWKSQETGANGTVTLHFDMSNVTNIANWSQLTLLVDGDGDFTTGATSIVPSVLSSTGILSVEFEHDFSNSEGFFFTLAKTTTIDLEITNPLPVIACDSFQLPPITGFNTVNPQYYSDTFGTGTVIPVGTVITADTVIYLYDETGAVPNQFDQDTLNINIINSTIGIDIRTECDSLLWIDGSTYYSNNSSATYTITGGASNGCDSIVTLDLTIINSSTSTDPRTECDSLLWIDGITYYSNNNSATYIITGGASNGCDSIVMLDLTIINLTTGTDIRTECDSLLWIDGITYYSNNNSATHTIAGGGSNGCDSVVTLDLTIIYPTNGTEIITACNSYDWNGNTYNTSNTTATHTIPGGASNGCDSIVTLDLTIINSSNGIDAQTGCGSFTWANGDGNTYSSNNSSATYAIPGGSANGCDSIITLNLTIFPELSISLGVDQYICEDTVLLSPGANFIEYFWSDNSNDSILLVTEPGIYSVTIKDNNGCLSSEASVELIEDCPSSFWVPNVFSPNGDDQNDIFNAVIDNAERYEMEIFNRWGNSLFQTNSILTGWTGEDASAGTYFYIIKYSYSERGELINKTVKGTVSLLK